MMTMILITSSFLLSGIFFIKPVNAQGGMCDDSASGELSRAVEEQREFIMGEILALSFHESAEVSWEEYVLESERFVIDLQKA